MLDVVDGEAIVAAWRGFDEAQQLEQQAIAQLDAALASISGVSTVELPEDELDGTSLDVPEE